MRFTAVSLALLALAHSVAPGVHGAPVVVSDRLAARQDPASVVTGLVVTLSDLVNTLENTLFGGGLPSAQVLQKIVQELKGALPINRAHRAIGSPSSAVIASPSARSSSSGVPNPPPATVGNASTRSTASTSKATSSVHPARMRRQSRPVPSPSPASSGAGSQKVPQPSQSVAPTPGSVPSLASSQRVTPSSAARQSTGGVANPSASRV